jgi:hypothetical protein
MLFEGRIETNRLHKNFNMDSNWWSRYEPTNTALLDHQLTTDY